MKKLFIFKYFLASCFVFATILMSFGIYFFEKKNNLILFSSNNKEVEGLNGSNDGFTEPIDPIIPPGPLVPIYYTTFYPREDDVMYDKTDMNVPFYYNPSFTLNYFKNLKTNRLNNWHGECGYVAVTMLLSFYDTYWNDNIIEEKYDKNEVIDNLDDYNFNESAGINNIIYENETLLSTEDYVELLLKNKNNDFEGYLASIAKKNYSIDTPLIVLNELYYKSGFYSINNASKDSMLALYSPEIKDLLVLYMYERGFFDYFEYIYNYSGEIITHDNYLINSNYVKNYNMELWNSLIPIVEEGIPIIVQVDLNLETTPSEDSNRHYFIIYGYDNVSGAFYGNYGNQPIDSYILIYPQFYYMLSYTYLKAKDSEDKLFYLYDNNNYILKNEYINSSKLKSHRHTRYDIENTDITHLVQCTCSAYYQEHYYTSPGDYSVQTCYTCGHKRFQGGSIYD